MSDNKSLLVSAVWSPHRPDSDVLLLPHSLSLSVCLFLYACMSVYLFALRVLSLNLPQQQWAVASPLITLLVTSVSCCPHWREEPLLICWLEIVMVHKGNKKTNRGTGSDRRRVISVCTHMQFWINVCFWEDRDFSPPTSNSLQLIYWVTFYGFWFYFTFFTLIHLQISVSHKHRPALPSLATQKSAQLQAYRKHTIYPQWAPRQSVRVH